MLYNRTVSELVESTRYGKLYRIERRHGNSFVCARVRRRGEGLFVFPGERVTIEQTPGSELEVGVGDFAFQDAGKTWALWKPTKPIKCKG